MQRRTPFLGSIDITNNCNLKCIHCFNRSNDLKRKELSDNEILEIIRDVADIGMYSFCFCGGEPLLRLDILLKSIRILKQSGCISVNMVSNGMLLSDEIAKRLKEAGIDSIQISLDGSCEKSHNKMRQNLNAFKGAINAIDILEKNNIKFGVAFCPTNFNINEFEELANMLNKYKNITELRVQPLMVMGRANSSIEASEYQYRQLVQLIRKLNGSGLYKFSFEWGDPVDHLIRFGKYLKGDTQLIINSNGNLMVSPYLPIVVGSLRKHSLKEYIDEGLCNVWQSTVVQEYASKIRSVSDLGKSINGHIAFVSNNFVLDLVDDKGVFIADES